jgi:hypothetical protein
MREDWRIVLPGLGIAFGAAGGFVVYMTSADILYVAYGAALGLVLGAIAASLTKPKAAT